jgi:hypothetical protein
LARKNADKIHKNISASKMHKNSGRFLKIRRIYKVLALFQKSGGFPKFRLISKIQADFQNSGGFPKFRRLQKIRRPYCLGLAESPAADFLLVWLKSSRSDPRRCVASLSCRPQVRDGLPARCFYLRTLSHTVLVVPAQQGNKPKFARKSKN